jgi:molybdate transport system regulatory protein
MNYKVKSRIWIEGEEGMFLGNGRVKLLKAIDETGSLTKAAKSMKHVIQERPGTSLIL